MIGLMWHQFHNEREHPKVQGSFSAQELAQVIEKHRDVLCSAKEVCMGVALGNYESLLDPTLRVLTFDDGLRCQYDIARPVLQAFNLTAFWFVPTAPLVGVRSRLEIWRWVRTCGYASVEDFYQAFAVAAGFKWLPDASEGYLAAHTYLSKRDRDFRFTRDVLLTPPAYEAVMDRLTAELCPPPDLWLTAHHLRTLAHEGHVIGSHSHRHPTVLSSLTKEEQEVEYATSTWVLSQILGERPIAVSHPCNQVTPHGLAYLKALGYRLGFNATPHAGSSLLELGRIDAADVRPKEEV